MTVLGDVERPRTVPFRPGMRLSEALARAGGPNDDADEADVRVIRGPLSSPAVYRASLEGLVGGEATDVELAPGDTVGYGSSFTATKPMRIGIVACGYADGYPRHAGSGTPVLVDGVRSTTVGRVSMDMLAVDLSALPDAGPGSEVTLWGRSSAGAVLPIDEVAQSAGTIAYELMCALALRVPVVLTTA